MATPKKRNHRTIPPPPPPNARWMTLDEVCGYLRRPRSSVNRDRRSDPSFPLPRLLGGGSPRWNTLEIDAWVNSKTRGWATTGGVRPSNFGRKKPGDADGTAPVAVGIDRSK